MLGDRRGVVLGKSAVPNTIRPMSIDDRIGSVEARTEAPARGDARRHTTRDQLPLHRCHEFDTAASTTCGFSARDLVRAYEQMTHADHDRNRTGSVAARLDRQSTSVVRDQGWSLSP